MRRYLKEDVGLDGTDRNDAPTASMIGGWEAARDRLRKLSKHSASARAEGRPKESPR